MGQMAVLVLGLLALLAVAGAKQCYSCDGVKGGGGNCPGNPPWSDRQEECGEEDCGLLLEEHLTFNKWRSSVVSDSSRWRRGCAGVRGRKITENSEVAGKQFTYGLGCQTLDKRDQDLTTISQTVCFCNTTLCNTHKNAIGSSNSMLPLQHLALALALVTLAA